MISPFPGVASGMLVEIWSDVVCPWCYVGKRRFEAALANFEHREDVEIVWRSFELAPGAPRARDGSMASHLARKYGLSEDQATKSIANLTDQAAGEGLDFRLDISRGGNTFDAHRLLHFAEERGLQSVLKERLLAAYFTEGVAIGEPTSLAQLAVDVGLPADEVDAVLSGDAFALAVREDEQAARDLDITAVPTFVIDRTFSVPGAQDSQTMLRVLERAWDRAHAVQEAR